MGRTAARVSRQPGPLSDTGRRKATDGPVPGGGRRFEIFGSCRVSPLLEASDREVCFLNVEMFALGGCRLGFRCRWPCLLDLIRFSAVLPRISRLFAPLADTELPRSEDESAAWACPNPESSGGGLVACRARLRSGHTLKELVLLRFLFFFYFLLPPVDQRGWLRPLSLESEYGWMGDGVDISEN